MAKVPPNPPDPPKPVKARRPSKAVADQVASVTSINAKKAAARTEGQRRRHNPNNPANLILIERRNRAYNLRRAGLTYQQIADQLGPMYELPNYTRQRAEEDVSAIRDGIEIQPAKDQLFDDLERVQALLTAVWTEAMKGEVKAVREARGLLADRAKYLGLYSPVRHVLTGADGGPIQVQDLADPAVAFAEALSALDAVLPVPEQKQLPGQA